MAELDEKRIIICADDFGMNPAIDAGILQLAQNGRLNATSCLVDGPSFRGNTKALQDSGLQMGLHVNFTESLGRRGVYMPLAALIAQAWFRRLDATALRRQIACQLDSFEDAFGTMPDFVDGHQHVHQFPQIRLALLSELESRYSGRRPWLRSTRCGSLSGLPASMQAKAHIVHTLGAPCFTRQADKAGFPLNRRFLGVYDFKGGEQAYRHLLRRWLSHARDGDLIMCHPASLAVASDALGDQRYAEFQVLGGADMQTWLREYQVTLS